MFYIFCRNLTNKIIKTSQTGDMASNDDPDYQEEVNPSSSKTSTNDAVSPFLTFLPLYSFNDFVIKITFQNNNTLLLKQLT